MKLIPSLFIAVSPFICSIASAETFGGRQYAVAVYRGPIAKPNFSGKGASFHQLRTVISQGFRKGATFAGHYTLVSFGCGANCVMTVMGDVKTGALSSFPIGGEGYNGLDMSFTADSRFVAVRWSSDFQRVDCIVQQYVLTGGKLVAHGGRQTFNQPCLSE